MTIYKSFVVTKQNCIKNILNWFYILFDLNNSLNVPHECLYIIGKTSLSKRLNNRLK